MNEKEVIRALKSERCPPSVLKRVQAAIRDDKSSVAGWRWRVPVGVSVAALALLFLFFIYFNDPSIVTEEIAADKDTAHSIDETDPAKAAVVDYRAEAEKLQYVFTYIGLTLAEETERNRDIILRNTVPIVRDSIANTEKIIHNINKRGRKL